MSDIRLGILGPGRIVERVMRDYHNMRGVTLTAVASRSIERAKEATKRYGAKHAFGSYDELAKCDEVDLVYLATPHNFHCEQAILLMNHGKHVLCEKSMAINDAQTRRMTECALKNRVFLMEAMWTRFFPASRKLRELVKKGAIGNVTHVFADFAATGSYDPTSRAFDPALAGGSILDLGIYPMMAATDLLGYEPDAVQGLAHLAPSGVDMRASIQMQYPSGATVQILSAFDAMGESREVIYGDAGRIVVPDFWHPTSFTLTAAGGKPTVYHFRDEAEGHHYEFIHAADCIREGRMESPEMSWAESIAVSKIFTDLRKSWGFLYPGES